MLKVKDFLLVTFINYSKYLQNQTFFGNNLVDFREGVLL